VRRWCASPFWGGVGHFSAIRGAFSASFRLVVRRGGEGGAQFDSDYSGGDDASVFFFR